MFGQANMDSVKAELDRLDGNNKNLKIKSGTTRVRILPPDSEANGVWWKATAIHYGFIIGGEFKKYICPRTVGRVSCPICDAASRFYQAGGENDRKIYSKIKAKREYYYVAYNVEQPTEIKVMRAPETLHKQIMNVVRSYGSIWDPQQGYDLFITATPQSTPTGTFLSYTIIPNKSPSPVLDSIKKLESTMINLNSMFTVAADDAELVAALKCIDTQDRTADNIRHQSVPPGQPTPPPPAGTPMCLKNGSYNASDADCQVCAYNSPCQENKRRITDNFQKSNTTSCIDPTTNTGTPPSSTPTLGSPATIPAQQLEDLQKRLRGGR